VSGGLPMRICQLQAQMNGATAASDDGAAASDDGALRRKKSQLRHRNPPHSPRIFFVRLGSAKGIAKTKAAKRSGPLTRFEAMGKGREEMGGQWGRERGGEAGVTGRAEQGASSELRRLLREPQPPLH
jgi:hypothetical protein